VDPPREPTAAEFNDFLRQELSPFLRQRLDAAFPPNQAVSKAEVVVVVEETFRILFERLCERSGGPQREPDEEISATGHPKTAPEKEVRPSLSISAGDGVGEWADLGGISLLPADPGPDAGFELDTSWFDEIILQNFGCTPTSQPAVESGVTGGSWNAGFGIEVPN